ncbi:hypothetical protein BC937DRAFT_95200 [Endogone sp. FLAS-F59071]|nr:hypothetical protein BC937DRAFT_95200 [Endogone sp. FLAS-F59071]|eukprot:RUS13513.1 hypothetical protein BC937DRAFT_95200 [Endogone sp. FLAS-F59071]
MTVLTDQVSCPLLSPPFHSQVSSFICHSANTPSFAHPLTFLFFATPPQILPSFPPSPPPVSAITLATHTLTSCPVRSFNLLIVDSSNGLITTHTDGLGYTSGDLAGKRLDVVLNPDSAVTLPPDPSCCDGPGATCEASDGYTLVAGTHKNGTAMWLNVCVHEVAASGTKPDAPTYHIWLIRDVTRLRWLASLSGFSSTARDRSPFVAAPTAHPTTSPASASPASLGGSASHTTVVLRLTRFGVIDSVFPAAFLGVASHSLVNTPVMARVHREDVRTLCRGLIDVHKNSYSTFKVRWRVGGGCEGFYYEDDDEEEEDIFDKTALDETTVSSHPAEFSSSLTTTAVPSSTYEWVHVTAMLSTSTNPSSVNDPICIVRTASSLPPDQLSSPFLIPERYIQQTALDHYRLPAGASALAVWPVTFFAAPVRALWDDLNRALEDGRQYVAEYLAYVVAVVVDALVWMSGVDVKRIASGRSDGQQIRAIEGGEGTALDIGGPTPSPTTSSSSEDSLPTTPTTENAVALRYRPTAPAASATLKAVLRHVEARPAVQAALGYLERVGLGERSAAIVPYLEKCVDGGCEWLFEGRVKGRVGAQTGIAAESKEK